MDSATTTVVRRAEELMEATMARYDVSHDAHHVYRVRTTALALATHPAVAPRQPDLLVVELAALLHDVLDPKYASPEAAADPYAFFLPFFRSVASHVDLVATGQAALIVQVIQNVSWTTEKKLRDAGKWDRWHEQCVELHCVQDADRLDAIGAFGILRCAAYSAAVNRPLHVPNDEAPHHESAIAHFHDKLLHVQNRLKTAPGKQLGEKRHQFMLSFLQQVDEEASAALHAPTTWASLSASSCAAGGFMSVRNATSTKPPPAPAS